MPPCAVVFSRPACFSALEIKRRTALNCGVSKLIVFLITCSALATGRAQMVGQLDAYTALQTVGREKGEALLANVVEIRGVDAAPQPLRWTLSFKDAAARGGIREYVVAAKGIIAERAPLRPAAGAGGPMTAKGLKLNSTGVFDAVNREATAKKVGFSSLNYLLENKNGAPVWVVELFDFGGAAVGRAEFSARNGTMTSPFKVLAAPSSPVAAVSATPDARPVGERWVEGGGLVGHVERWSTRTWEATTNTATRVGDSIGAFFTGRPARQSPAPGN